MKWIHRAVSTACLCALLLRGRAEFSLDRVRDCLDKAAKPPKGQKDVPNIPKDIPKKRLFLHFGDGGIEGMNVLDASDMRRIDALARCAREEDSQLFEDRSDPSVSDWYGGSNRTYLSGAFQQLLPELLPVLRDTVAKALARADWPSSGPAAEGLGVRSVLHLSFRRAGLKKHRKEMVTKMEAEFEGRNNFIIYGNEEERLRAQLLKERGSGRYDEYADYAVFKHLHEPASAEAGAGQGTLYTAVLLLTDRSAYAGGNVMSLRHRGRKRLLRRKSKVELRANTGEDEEEEVWEEIPEEEENESRVDDRGRPKFYAKYDPTSSQVSRFTPEKGGMLLLHGEFAHGMLPLLYGDMRALVIEFWAHADTELGTKRPPLGEARPLPLHLGASPHSDL